MRPPLYIGPYHAMLHLHIWGAEKRNYQNDNPTRVFEMCHCTSPDIARRRRYRHGVVSDRRQKLYTELLVLKGFAQQISIQKTGNYSQVPLDKYKNAGLVSSVQPRFSAENTCILTENSILNRFWVGHKWPKPVFAMLFS